ncbi:MAG: SDR family oxidoreductase [Deltaproteobacteria bacterium]|nr:SDR family oxidoreductase [Deltaproteobacteria bacterium]
MNLHNASMMITGASRGLGLSLAQTLAKRGAKVVLVARGLEVYSHAESLVRQGHQAFALQADLRDAHAIHPVIAQANALVGPLDGVIHNAATLGVSPLRTLVDTPCESLSDALALHVLAPFRINKIVGAAMALRGEGALVHITTDAAVEAYAQWGAYGISKAAMDHLMRSFAAELGPHGVRSFSVDPGEMNTALHHEALPDVDPNTLQNPSWAADRIADLLEHSERAPSGARVVLGAEVAS